MTFTKLFSSITESSVWSEDDQTRIVWITMLAMADWKGYVYGSIPGLANRARVPIEATEEALRKFMAPDPYSRTRDNEGRRVEEVDGGWRLLTYAKHRDRRDEEKKREYMREYMRAKRPAPTAPTVGAVSQDVSSKMPTFSSVSRELAHTDTDTDTEKEKTRAEPFFSPFVEESQTPEDQPPINLAKGLAAKLNLHPDLVYVIEKAIRLAAVKKATSFAGAFDYLVEMATKARDDSKEITRFWFQNADGWEPKPPKPKAKKRDPPPPDGVALKRAQLQAARERGEIE